MKTKVFLIVFFIMCQNMIVCQNNDNLNIRIAKYKGDKACAISYTFDDGLREHYTMVAPEFEKYGFKGTFWINGSKVNENATSIRDTTRVTWADLKEMSANGHEISNHGWAHKNFSRHTLEEIKEDIYKNDSAIFANIGIMPRTFCYPNNNKQKEGRKIAVANRVGTRTEQRSIGSKSTPQDLENWVNTLISSNDWGVGMTHGITYGYDAFKSPSVFWDHLAKVKALEDSIWIATFHDVAAYTTERDSITWKIVETKKNSLTITLELPLDKALFKEKLTMVIDKKGVEKVKVIQDGKNLVTQLFTDKIIFDFDPHGAPIQLFLK